MNNRLKQVKTTPKAQALLDALKALREAQGRRPSSTLAVCLPTEAMRLTYREVFRVLREANPAISYVTIQSYIRIASRTEGAR
tara:strand:- start:436 stop:684 length:249 start_codon:yes stop_codon:yes gene_type:complete